MQKIIKIDSLGTLRNFFKKLKLTFDYKIIIIDGPMQSGKTSVISPNLAEILNIPLLHLDDHIIKNDSKLHLINYKSLKKTIKTLLKDSSHLIIEGILIKKHLEQLNIDNVYWMYVKTIKNGKWAQEDDCDIDRINDYQLDISLQESNPLYKQVFDYHKDYYPYKRADLIIEIDETLIL